MKQADDTNSVHSKRSETVQAAAVGVGTTEVEQDEVSCLLLVPL